MSNLYDLLASEVVDGIKEGLFTTGEYVCSVIKRIEDVESKLHSFISLDSEGAVSSAKLIDRKLREKEKIGPLCGIIVGIKDNISTKNIKTTCASKMLEDYIPPYDATVVRHMKENGAIIMGKLNLDEFGMGSTTEYSRYGPTHNPWNLDYVPGGSSGGCGAAVASGECTVSLGSDTGGSIRCPASFCSVVGLKPTYGRVSRFGLVSYANSLEQIGPIGKNVSDVVMVMNAIAGSDEKDHTTGPLGAAPKYSLKSGQNLRVGLIKKVTEEADPDVSKCIYDAMELFANSGCKCEEISLASSLRYALSSYYTIAMAEASSNLSRYDNVRYGFDMSPDGYEWNTYFMKVRSNFGEEVKRRIIVGSYVLSSAYYGKYYLKAQKVRSMLIEEFKLLFKKFDVLVSPTMPILPFKIGEKISDPLKIYQIDVNTVVANLTGMPAISVPAGFSNGLPIGLQLMADILQEQKLLDAAALFEEKLHPPAGSLK